MTARKGKRAATDTDEIVEVDGIAEAVDRALEAVRMADDAAEDIEAMRKEQNAFVEKVKANTKNVSALAIGAFAGAAVAVVLSGLVYFRSVKDLRENAELQAETLAQILSQTAALQEVVVQAGNQQGTLTNDIRQSISEATERLSSEMGSFAEDIAGFQPQMATGLNDEITSQIGQLRTDLMGAVADLDLSLTGLISTGSTGGSPEAMTELTALVGELRTAIAQAAPRAVPSQSSTPRRSSSSTRSSSAQRAPETNPYSYP